VISEGPSAIAENCQHIVHIYAANSTSTWVLIGPTLVRGTQDS